MFWWGPPPKAEIRQHGNYYPACNGKCKPILTWMLQELDVAPARHREAGHEALTAATAGVDSLYEDDSLAVVAKPPGLLSVPGRDGLPSVYSILKERWKGRYEPFMVHRLDMATSGLLVVARSPEAHRALQAQFTNHTVRKQYTALLSLSFLDKHLPPEGRIEQPLSPLPDDRPRQCVDYVNGKTAVTEYRVAGKTTYGKTGQEAVKVILYPLTGRTHQLRIHCAHPDGLGTPIIGDSLYGQHAGRLWLHAGHLEFTHPVTGKKMVFDVPLQHLECI